MNWMKWCAKYEWVAVNRLIQKMFIPPGPRDVKLSVLVIIIIILMLSSMYYITSLLFRFCL